MVQLQSTSWTVSVRILILLLLSVFTNHSPSDGTLMVGFDEPSYTFSENQDPETVMVCLDLIDSVITREVSIMLTLRAGTALRT